VKLEKRTEDVTLEELEEVFGEKLGSLFNNIFDKDLFSAGESLSGDYSAETIFESNVDEEKSGENVPEIENIQKHTDDVTPESIESIQKRIEDVTLEELEEVFGEKLGSLFDNIFDKDLFSTDIHTENTQEIIDENTEEISDENIDDDFDEELSEYFSSKTEIHNNGEQDDNTEVSEKAELNSDISDNTAQSTDIEGSNDDDFDDVLNEYFFKKSEAENNDEVSDDDFFDEELSEYFSSKPIVEENENQVTNIEKRTQDVTLKELEEVYGEDLSGLFNNVFDKNLFSDLTQGEDDFNEPEDSVAQENAKESVKENTNENAEEKSDNNVLKNDEIPMEALQEIFGENLDGVLDEDFIKNYLSDL
jgi:hypothetical protein